MIAFIGLTVALFLGLAFSSAHVKRTEIMANWSKYKGDLLYMFTATMFKPDDDPRSRIQFATDNFHDVISDKVKDFFEVLLQPVMKIFQLLMDAMIQTLSGLFNIKALMGNMWKKWNEITDVFMRRFNSVFHQLRVTFVKLYASMEKTFGIAASSIYMGLSTIDTILSFMDLMIKIIIIIMAILIIMMIFLFWMLFPVMPLILMAVTVLIVAGVGAAAGMTESFCFAGNTPIITKSGTTIPIKDVKIGTELYDGGIVTGTMDISSCAEDLYNLYGITVSGSHIVYVDNKPVHVKDHPDAKHINTSTTELYCLITTTQRIPVYTSSGHVDFADWEELSTKEDLESWHKHVFGALNPNTEYIPASSVSLMSESVFSGRTRVVTSIGPAELRGIRPGCIVLDADGKPTRVLGIVRVSGMQVEESLQISTNAYISAGAWLKTGTTWKQPIQTKPHTEEIWYSLFTESGTFQLYEAELLSVRDFSDVGSEHIHETYDWVLRVLQSNSNPVV